MRYLSVCSGIEAATAAWHPLGWEPAAFAAIDPFPRAVLSHHYPTVPLHGDFTTIRAGQYGSIRLLVGGTPCQSFSVAGLRKGLDDPRGNLALAYLRLAEISKVQWIVWENVPGVLSSVSRGANGSPPDRVGVGRGERVVVEEEFDERSDFGCFLAALSKLGYGFAYRVLDAQFFGVPQRRKRIILVGYLGDWRRAAAVLFESESLRGNPPPSREERKDVASRARSRFEVSGGDRVAPGTFRLQSFGEYSEDGTASALKARDYKDPTDLVTYPVGFNWQNGGGYKNSHDGLGVTEDGVGPLSTSQVPAVIAFNSDQSEKTRSMGESEEQSPILRSGGQVAVAFKASHYTRGKDGAPAEVYPPLVARADKGDQDPLVLAPCDEVAAFTVSDKSNGFAWESDVHPTLQSHPQSDTSDRQMGVRQGYAVRRITPREAERLQGFPDDYTLIPYGKKGQLAGDGARYKALGNSMAVPVMRWIGERIAMVDGL